MRCRNCTVRDAVPGYPWCRSCLDRKEFVLGGQQRREQYLAGWGGATFERGEPLPDDWPRKGATT